uniref:NDK-6 n=1 Tax=Dendrocoelum lacteum TaxID=27895 RepID=T1DBL7_9PLAT
MLSLILKITIVTFLGHFMAIAQPRNIKYKYQGISKLGLVGSKFIIECPLTGPFYFWRLFQANLDSRVLLDQDSKSITFDFATTDKSGIYECKSTTGFGNAVINITIKILDPKSEISKEICSFRDIESSQDYLGGVCFLNDKYQKKTRYKMGSNIELDCQGVGLNLMYTWKFIDQTGLQVKMSKSDNISRIIITNLIPENEGIYKCEVMNEQGSKIYRSFSVSISDLSAESGIEIIGEKLVFHAVKYGENISMSCEIKNSYQRIHSIKWGKRIDDHIMESKMSNNIVLWDQHNYKVLPTLGIIEAVKEPNRITSTLILKNLEISSSGIYICLAMNTFGGTAYKLFNLTVSPDIFMEHSVRRSQFFFLYILTPTILIFICICGVIYCCVKTNTTKSSNTVPLKQCNSSIPSNGNKSAASNYYYPATSPRVNTNYSSLPQPTESQSSFVSPNTLMPYNSYGNYHFAPQSQTPFCNSNGV